MRSDVGADGPAADRAGDVAPSCRSAADLVAEDAADHAADDGAADVRVLAFRLGDLLRSIQQRCSGGPTTARTEVTGPGEPLVGTARGSRTWAPRAVAVLVVVGCAPTSTGRTDEMRSLRPMPRSES